jgi:prepilin-type N-terminal cleavage/methylation domain-containing protein
MKPLRTRTAQSGFTLIELMVSVGIFLLICGAVFELMGTTQNRFKTESQVLGSFEEARLGLDQIVRDVNDAGYPPQNHFSATVPVINFAGSPIAWSPQYLPTPSTPCQIGTAGGGTCVTPGDFDIIIETIPNPDDPACTPNCPVQWIRYQLQGTTLFRGTTPKVANDPVGATSPASGVMLPYVLNVVNNAPPAQIAQFQAAYPAMFPGGNPQPLFQFTCDSPAGPVLCQNAAGNNSPANVRAVDITLIVMTPNTDAQTNQIHLVELNGRGHRVNPNQ